MALDILLAILGIAITALVVAGMILLEPRHLVSTAAQTDLSDVKRHRPAGRPTRAKPATDLAAEPRREPGDASREGPNDGDRPASNRRTRAQPKEHA